LLLGTGLTAAEIVYSRADETRPNMGLTTWRKAPKGKIFKSDVGIAKNYLHKDELQKLNHIVDMYLDYAELQASKGKPMYMKNWAKKLDAFLQFNEQEILLDKGKVSHEVAMALAEEKYEKFRIEQDKNFISDFDIEVRKLRSRNLKETDY